MRIKKVTIIGTIESDTIGSRLYRLTPPVVIVEIVTYGFGIIRIKAYRNFETDGRSGGPLVDPIFPNWGTQLERMVVLVHDVLFYDFDISFETANELLRDLIIYIGKPDICAQLVYLGVSTPIARKAFGCVTQKEIDNKKLCDVSWDAK